jgi:hypothetical protein
MRATLMYAAGDVRVEKFATLTWRSRPTLSSA